MRWQSRGVCGQNCVGGLMRIDIEISFITGLSVGLVHQLTEQHEHVVTLDLFILRTQAVFVPAPAQ